MLFDTLLSLDSNYPTQDSYQKAIKFAAEKHKNQTLPGSDLSYLVHLASVAMEIMLVAEQTTEFNLNLAITVALLHDTLEDTACSYEELKLDFGSQVADGVQALTKTEGLSLSDYLNQIKTQPVEIQSVKLADRITNLQAPPKFWSREKIAGYKIEAVEIYKTLKNANAYLAKRLERKIAEYS